MDKNDSDTNLFFELSTRKMLNFCFKLDKVLNRKLREIGVHKTYNTEMCEIQCINEKTLHPSGRGILNGDKTDNAAKMTKI